MIKYINKIKPIILIEYNQSNFKDIYKKIKKNYNCYRYEIEKNSLIRLSAKQIQSLIMGNILEKKYRKNSVNLFYIHKNYSFQNFNKNDN